MNLRTILIVGLGLIVSGCAKEEQAAPEATDTAAPATEASAAPWVGDDSWRNAGFMEHMHLHAEKLDELNFALADGDLEAAMTPAEWLATHETYDDVQPDWLPFLYGMRTEAEAVAAATDLATAQVAAQRINAQCQGCHAAVGMATQ